MNGEYSMNHFDGAYNERGYDYHENHSHDTSKNTPTFLMLIIIVACSLSLNLLRLCTGDQSNGSTINSSPLLKKKDIIDRNLFNETCVICLENYEKEDKITTLECNHIFHHQCIVSWVENDNTCPLCRVTLL